MESFKIAVDHHKKNIEKDVALLSDEIVTTISTVGAKVEKEDQIEQLDKIMRSIAGEVARYQEMSSIAERIMRGGQGDRIAAIDAAIAELESKKFGDTIAEAAYKTSDNYREFVEANRSKSRRIGEGLELDDDLVVDSGAAGEVSKDPLTLMELAREGSGKYPIKMPCGHTYNWSTIMDKKNGVYSTKTCAVPGCRGGKNWPSDRSSLTECKKTKNMLQRKEKGIGSQSLVAGATQGEELEIDDL